MKRLAAEHGFDLYYALVAPQASYLDATDPDTPGYWDAFEYPKLLEMLETQPTFIHARFDGEVVGGDLDPSADLFDDGTRDANPYGTRHFNERGYELLARQIADRLTADNLLPRVRGSLPLRLTFGDGSARQWMRSGWYQDESAGGETHVWSEGMVSVVEVPLPSDRDVRMELDGRPFLFPSNFPQTVTILLNGTVIDELSLGSERRTYSVLLPVSVLREPANTLELRYAHVTRPRDVVAGSEDNRSLAVVWYSMTFEEAAP